MNSCFAPLAAGPSRRTGGNIWRRRILSVMVASAFASGAGVVFALPTGGQVAAGSATISQPSANRMRVDQSSASAILNWQSFSIGASQSVVFAQPSASAVALNRVLGNNASEIFGSLSANGRVFLVNPNGILFGPGASVDVGGLVASTLNIKDSDFLAGRYVFSRDGAAGSIVNQGTINAANGFVALIAPNVSNEGLISARLGSVAVGAGDRVTLDLVGDGLINVKVDEAALNASIVNQGTIAADGGQVVLSVRSANALLDTVLNSEGTVRATSMVERNGVIRLEGGEAGVVSVSGTLDASGRGAGEKGGVIAVLGDKVGLFGAARVDASGDAGGGTVLIGGNFQGKGPEQNANRTYVGPNTTINADAITNGNGGKVIVWADDTTRFYGSISARGGVNSGDGGFAEISGKQNLEARIGNVNLGAPKGNSGTLLLDPENIVITGGSADGNDETDASATRLKHGNGTSGEVLFGDGAGTYVVRESEIENTNANIDLQATNSITVSGTFNLDTNGEGTGSIVRLKNNRSLTMDTRNASGEGSGGINLTGVAVEFQTQGIGTITIRAGKTGVGAGGDAGSAPVIVGALTTLGRGSITLQAEGGLTVSGNITTAASTTSGTPSGAITLTADTSTITLNNNLTTGNATIADTVAAESATTGNISLTAATGISGAGVLTTGTASFTGVDAGTGADTATSGNITLNVTGAGDVGLSGANALTIGAATGNVATGLTATTGNITVTSADRVNNGTTPGALDMSFGLASLGSTNTAGTLTITTDGGAGAAGEIQITSGEALTVGVLNTADGTGQTISIVTTAGNLTWSGASTLDTDAVTLGGAATGVLTISAAQALGSFTGTGGSVAINGNLTASGNATSTATSGAITQSGVLTVGGNGSFTTAGGAITLTAANSFGGTVNADSTNGGASAAAAISITDSTAFVVGTVTGNPVTLTGPSVVRDAITHLITATTATLTANAGNVGGALGNAATAINFAPGITGITVGAGTADLTGPATVPSIFLGTPPPPQGSLYYNGASLTGQAPTVAAAITSSQAAEQYSFSVSVDIPIPQIDYPIIGTGISMPVVSSD